MNKKQLIIAAMAAAFSVSSVHAAVEVTNISNVTGANGVFNINPEKINGDVGYRNYANFDLKQGDIANLIYQGTKSGQIRDLNTFINMVQNKINIDGIVNAVKADGSGHAVFISPGGMAIGQSGVLNVGTLSVVTPTAEKFGQLQSEYAVDNFNTINNISQMRNGANRATEEINYGGNGKVDMNGYIFARNGVDIRGSQVNIGGGIVNGYAGVNNFGNNSFDGKTSAEALFNSLVNTNGIQAANALDNGSLVVVKSGAGTNAGINVTGKIANLANGETVITNHGDNGLLVSGLVVANKKLNVYNNNENSTMNVSGKLMSEKDAVSLSSKGGLNVQNTANLIADKNLEVVNKKGALTLAGTALSGGKTDIVNWGTNTTISGTVGNNSTTPTSIRIVNENGQLVFTGTAQAEESVSLRNNGNNGMYVAGNIAADEGVLIHNKAGNAELNGKVTVENGNIAVMNEGTGKLITNAYDVTSDTGSLLTVANAGKLIVKNVANNGMELNGKLVNNGGETAINNLNGEMVINGIIENTGHMGIINKENGTGLTVGTNAQIINDGKLKLVNNSGSNGMTINGQVSNEGKTNLYNEAGEMKINGKVLNSEDYLFIVSRNNSKGIVTGANSEIKNDGGSLALKHTGTGVNTITNRGMDLNGKIQNDAGEIAINNYKGDMYVAGTVKGEDNIGIINRAGGNNMTLNATVVGNNDLTNIKNYGAGNMTVNGDITHNGKLNVIANEGYLTVGADIHNQGTKAGIDGDRTYIVARQDKSGTAGDGISFTGTAESGNGLILIKNISGSNGLNFNGTLTSTNGQAEVYNKVGNMTVSGAINAHPAVVLNKGEKLTVTDAANLQGDVVIVNQGTKSATVPEKYKNNFHEKLKN